MKNVKPMLGAMSVVGKDSLGRKIILPTESKIIDKDPKKKPSWIKSLVNVFRKRKETETGTKLVRLTVWHAKNICAQHMDGVHDTIMAAQEFYRRNKRAKMGLKW